MSNDEHQQLRDTYARKKISEPPPPWNRITINIGGVTAVGFGADTEYLFVLTHSGVGIVDCATGKIVARKKDEEITLEDPFPVNATGIGPLAGQNVALAGIWGGGLRTTSKDGWVVHRASPNWPTECAVLCPPDHPELDDSDNAIMLLKDLDPPIRALGFSDSGKTLVVASTILFLWNRF